MAVRPFDHKLDAPDLSALDSTLKVADALAARAMETPNDVYLVALASSYLEVRRLVRGGGEPVRVVGGWMA